MAVTEHRDFSKPDEIREFPHGRVEVIQIAGGTVGRFVLFPGWRWSADVKPIAKTEWCEAPHFQYLAAGRLRIRMRDGAEFDLGPGSVSHLPAGHDAWVLGNEPAVLVDWHAAGNYAKR